MDFELSQGASRIEKEHQKRQREAKKKLEREALAVKAQQERDARMQEEVRLSRLQKLEQQAREEEERILQEIATGGIQYKKSLRVVPSTDTGDKISLPMSALAELTPQEAVKEGGVLCFEISWKQGTKAAVTHSGVLNFDAEEGTVGLPLKVARSLCLKADVPIQSLTFVTVRFVRLSKGSFVRLQPVDMGFQQELDIKSVLEKTLRTHTTLTVDDEVVVRYLGESYSLRVREARPDPQVMIINTDVEVELMPSEAAVRAQEEEARRKAAEEAKAREQEELLKRREEWKKAVAQRLPAAVAAGSPGSIKCLVRTPSGSCTRVFHQTNAWASLWDFVFAEGGIEPPFRLVSSFPRKVYEAPATGASTTFAQALSLSTPNPVSLALFVELPSTVPPSTPSSNSSSSSSSDSTESAAAAVPTPIKTPASSSSAFPSASGPSSASPRTAAWQQTQSTVENIMDTTPDHSSPLPGMTRIETRPSTDGDREARWAPQLFELATMGFFDTDLNISLLERYQGRTLRVINALSEQAKSPSDAKNSLPSAQPLPSALPSSSQRSSTPPPKGDNLYADELQQLENMGFTDRAVNRQLLERYQGRVVRVVNYLSEMPQSGQ